MPIPQGSPPPPPGTPPPGALEITFRSLLLGVALSVILAAANAYLGLFAGMTVSASIPAAVVSMGILKALRRGGILENNIVQTSASAGESLAAGVIFIMPALVLLDVWTDFSYLWVTVIALCGGLLGVLFTIPLRRALIVDRPLTFPEGVATAEVLRSGERGGRGIWRIAQGALAAGLFKLGEAGLRLWTGAFEGAVGAGNSLLYFGSNLSPALVSVGYIVGLNIAILIFIGGAINWMVAIPICALWTPPSEAGMSALDRAYEIWSTRTRYLGVGAMLIGGLWTIFRLRSSLLGGVRSGVKAWNQRRTSNGGCDAVELHERDIPMPWVIGLTLAAIVPIFIIYHAFSGGEFWTLPMAIVMLATGFLFSTVAAYMAGLVGSSSNPISGVTIATVFTASLVLLALGARVDDPRHAAAAAILVGSVVCCAAAIAGDNMQDLKTGHLVGATPWKQQVMQMVGTVSAALVMAPILSLLLNAYGFAGHASAKDEPLIAAQANLMASVALGVFGGSLPWNYVISGILLGSVAIVLDSWLEARKSEFRTPVLAIAVGIYLPLQLATPIFAGGLVAHALRRRAAANALEPAHANNQPGLLLASGLITGEALMGILLAIPILLAGRGDVLAIAGAPLGPWPGALLLLGVLFWLYRVAARRA